MIATPAKLGARGRKLYRDLHPAGVDVDPATEVLIVEACRIADRLERLDGMLRGQSDEWFRIEVPDVSTDDGALTVVVNSALAEARLQATALRGLLAPLTKAVEKPKAAEVSASDEVARRRAARRAAAASS